MATAPGPVAVLGAGSVGCWVGGCLAAAGLEVHFVGRPRVLDALRRQGLTLTDLEGQRRSVAPERLHLHETPPPVAALWLLTVKSGATADAVRGLAPGSLLLSLQNGIGNAQRAAAAAPGIDALPGMVPYNVAELGPGHFHRGTTGVLAAQDHPALPAWRPVFEAAGVPLQLHADLLPVQWSKLLLNLNNPVNALSGLPLRAELMERDYRRVFAALQAEALAAMQAAGITPVRITPLPPHWLPRVLRLPTPLFARIAKRMLAIDAKARSSMADDLALGRRTEIDAFCGEVVRLARAHGRDAPLNARMQQLVETDPRPRSGRELRAALGV